MFLRLNVYKKFAYPKRDRTDKGKDQGKTGKYTPKHKKT